MNMLRTVPLFMLPFILSVSQIHIGCHTLPWDPASFRDEEISEFVLHSAGLECQMHFPPPCMHGSICS